MAETLNGWLKRIPILPLYFLALVPGAWLIWRAFNGMLGAEPVRALEDGLGLWALKFMLAALTVTPLRTYTGVNLIRFRRALGLTTFFYAILHLSVYLLLDRQLVWSEIITDLYKRPYIMFGMSAFAILVPLAITSNDAMVRRLGAIQWKKLHMLAYPAAVLIVMHYLLLEKTWSLQPLVYAAIAAILLGTRLIEWRRRTLRRQEASGQPKSA